MRAAETLTLPFAASWRRYLELTKPRVLSLLLFTAAVGMLLAIDGPVPWSKVIWGLVGIGLASAAGAAINHVVDHRIDSLMARTCARPIPTGQVDVASAVAFALLLGAAAMWVLSAWVNTLTAVLTFAAMIGYAVVYTMFLKRSTPQNIVWGGAAGAAPPLLGHCAVTGEVTLDAWVLFLIIFVWTPPHFWPLAIHRHEEYRHAGIPMLPITHGIEFTKAQVLIYSVMLFAVSLLPFAFQSAGVVYFAGAFGLGVGFIYQAWLLWRSPGIEEAMPTFRYSLVYLACLFALMIGDHLVRI